MSSIPCSQLPKLPKIPQVHNVHCCPGSHQDLVHAAHLVAVGWPDKHLPDVQLLKVEAEPGSDALPSDAQGQSGLTAWGDISISVQ